jgi:hypothetical protein
VSEDLDDTVIVPRPAVPALPELVAPDDGHTIIMARAAPVLTHLVANEPVPPLPPESSAIASGFYAFRLGPRSEAIVLDVPCYVGRRPSAPRISSGEAPRLLEVPSPLKEVSATHLGLRQLGSSVIVTDLGSTNGSVVLVPGSVPRKLRQGESVVVSPGTLVDIGDDNILQILPMQRPA